MKQASMFPEMGLKEPTQLPSLSYPHPFTQQLPLPLLKELVSRDMDQNFSYHFVPHLSCRKRKYPSHPKLSCVNFFSHGSLQENRRPAY